MKRVRNVLLVGSAMTLLSSCGLFKKKHERCPAYGYNMEQPVETIQSTTVLEEANA